MNEPQLSAEMYEELEKLTNNIQDIWDAEYHSNRFTERLQSLNFSDYEILTDLIYDTLKAFIATALEEQRAEYVRK